MKKSTKKVLKILKDKKHNTKVRNIWHIKSKNYKINIKNTDKIPRAVREGGRTVGSGSVVSIIE